MAGFLSRSPTKVYLIGHQKERIEVLILTSIPAKMSYNTYMSTKLSIVY